MKVALYARVSKHDESQDPENQLRILRQYARDHGYDVYQSYVDRASGADQNRPELDRMLAYARGNRFSMVLVVRIDRMARSMPNLYNILSALEAESVGFHCTEQPSVSTTTASGKLMLNILGAVAEFERDLISDRTKDGLARARAAGKRLGRPQKRIDMARAHELQAQGLGCRKIAEELGISRQTLWSRLKNEGVNSEKESSSVPPG